MGSTNRYHCRQYFIHRFCGVHRSCICWTKPESHHRCRTRNHRRHTDPRQRRWHAGSSLDAACTGRAILRLRPAVSRDCAGATLDAAGRQLMRERSRTWLRAAARFCWLALAAGACCRLDPAPPVQSASACASSWPIGRVSCDYCTVCCSHHSRHGDQPSGQHRDDFSCLPDTGTHQWISLNEVAAFVIQFWQSIPPILWVLATFGIVAAWWDLETRAAISYVIAIVGLMTLLVTLYSWRAPGPLFSFIARFYLGAPLAIVTIAVVRTDAGISDAFGSSILKAFRSVRFQQTASTYFRVCP